MNDEKLKWQWKHLGAGLKARWHKLTDDDVEVAVGNAEYLVRLLQERYGIAREEATRQIRNSNPDRSRLSDGRSHLFSTAHGGAGVPARRTFPLDAGRQRDPGIPHHFEPVPWTAGSKTIHFCGLWFEGHSARVPTMEPSMSTRQDPSQHEPERFPPRRQRDPSNNDIPARRDPKREGPRGDARRTERRR